MYIVNAKFWLINVRFIIHYLLFYVRFGPFRAHWCMRFEAKNHFFKRGMMNNSFKNVHFRMALPTPALLLPSAPTKPRATKLKLLIVSWTQHVDSVCILYSLIFWYSTELHVLVHCILRTISAFVGQNQTFSYFILSVLCLMLDHFTLSDDFTCQMYNPNPGYVRKRLAKFWAVN